MKTKRYHRVKAEMNVVPYIDVMLVLLVIFMIAAPLIQQSVKIDLPQSQQTISAKESDGDLTLPLILSVDRDGRYYLNISAAPEEALTNQAIIAQTQQYLAAHPNIDVYVRGDRNVDYARVIDGLEILNQAGAEHVNLSTQPPDGQP